MKNLSPIQHTNKDPHRYPKVQVPIENKCFVLFNVDVRKMVKEIGVELNKAVKK